MNWFRLKKPLRGCGWRLIDDEKDVVALKTKEDPDKLTSIIKYCFGYYLQERRDTQPKSWGPIYYFNEAVISRIVEAIAVSIAVIFLIGAIISLYCVERMEPRLGILSAFTIAFATIVGLLANAKKIEIFAAAAAYVCFIFSSLVAK